MKKALFTTAVADVKHVHIFVQRNATPNSFIKHCNNAAGAVHLFGIVGDFNTNKFFLKRIHIVRKFFP